MFGADIYEDMAELLQEASEKSETWSGIPLETLYIFLDIDVLEEDLFPLPGNFLIPEAFILICTGGGGFGPDRGMVYELILDSRRKKK
jgi:hypothetical protein